MAGAVIENVSSKKLYLGVGMIFLLSVGGFLLGGLLIQSRPHAASTNIATECLVEPDKTVYMPYHPVNAPKVPNQECKSVEDVKQNLHPTDIVHALHLPKNGDSLSRWFSYLLILVYPNLDEVAEIADPMASSPTDEKIFFDATIFYRDDVNEIWKTAPHLKANFSRNYKCETVMTDDGAEVSHHECDPMHFVELGSVPHKYYLINFKLPLWGANQEEINRNIGRIEHINMPVIYQPPEFTKVWLGLQTAVFLAQWFSLSWFFNRLKQLNRPKTLIEKSILALGVGMQVANCPVHWIALVFDAPWMLLFCDIRQGFAYLMLFTFWLVFISEHLLDRPCRNNLWNYKFQLALVSTAAISMFVFDCVERGIQLSRPFWSVWDSTHGRNAALVMPIIGGVCGGLYTLYLCILVAKVSFNLIKRREHFVGRLHAEGLIIRFQAIIAFTIFCAVFSLAVFCYHEAIDTPAMITGYHIEVQSAVYTGLYVLWNCYVLSVMLLYAPSHKKYFSPESVPLNSEVSSISASRADSIQSIAHSPPTIGSSTADLLAPFTQNKPLAD